MATPPLDLALFYLSFKLNTNEELVVLSNAIVAKNLLANHTIEEILNQIWREVGRDTISMRRWKDVVFI